MLSKEKRKNSNIFSPGQKVIIYFYNTIKEIHVLKSVNNEKRKTNDIFLMDNNIKSVRIFTLCFLLGGA